MVKYKATVTHVGPLTREFVEAGILVLFGESAPEELREFAILHDGRTLHAPLAPGDTLHIAAETFRLLAIGEVANSNLANLGHLVVKFNGQTTPEMPGDVCVEARPLPAIDVGVQIQVTN